MSLSSTNKIIVNSFTNNVGSLITRYLVFIESYEELLHYEKTKYMLVLGVQYFKTMLLSFFFWKHDY